jgi:hypothetical protein
MTNTNYSPLDSLRYINSHCFDLLDYVIDSLGCSKPNGLDEEQTEDLQSMLESIQADIRTELKAHASDATMPGRLQYYSNGRRVNSAAVIEDGLVTSHTWHPDATAQESRSWRSSLPSDPGIPSPGIYEVTLEPTAQDIHVRVVRIA